MPEPTDAQKDILQRIAECVQTGKADATTNIPPGAKDKPGVAEWVDKALAEGVPPNVVDLGVDCSDEKFTAAIREYPGCVIGLSALLTTTMVAMRETVLAIRQANPNTTILIGGAPVTEAFTQEIGATAYAADPAAAVDVLNRFESAA